MSEQKSVSEVAALTHENLLLKVRLLEYQLADIRRQGHAMATAANEQLAKMRAEVGASLEATYDPSTHTFTEPQTDPAPVAP